MVSEKQIPDSALVSLHLYLDLLTWVEKAGKILGVGEFPWFRFQLSLLEKSLILFCLLFVIEFSTSPSVFPNRQHARGGGSLEPDATNLSRERRRESWGTDPFQSDIFKGIYWRKHTACNTEIRAQESGILETCDLMRNSTQHSNSTIRKHRAEMIQSKKLFSSQPTLSHHEPRAGCPQL